MAVLISDLTIFSTELVSILRAKLWKLKMECKNGMFFNFWVLFLKMHIFEIVTFLSRLVLIQLTKFFSRNTYLQYSYFLMKYFLS